jgi:hypothetical protein
VQPRELNGVGNLEEALAEAYASAMSTQAAEVDQQGLSLVNDILRETGTNSLPPIDELVRESFLSDRRPRGYSSGHLFVDQMGWLLFQHDLTNVDSFFKVASASEERVESLYENLRCLTWMFDELLGSEPNDSVTTSRDARRPFSRRIFCAFLENFRHEFSWFADLLLPPEEDVEPRRGSSSQLFTPGGKDQPSFVPPRRGNS